MMHLKFRGVNDAFRGLVGQFDNMGESGDYSDWCAIVRSPSRNGSVLRIDEPVLITYEKPLERVLFNEVRDASPFLHVYEALHMLAGRNDVASLAYYAKQFNEYSDDGETLNGAYGYRWRHANPKQQFSEGPGGYDGTRWTESTDQLDVIATHLRTDPHSRRAVLQMWNVSDDLLKIGLPCEQCGGSGTYEGRYTPDDQTSEYVEESCEDCNGRGVGPSSKDVACNLSVMFAVREEDERIHTGDGNVINDDGPARYLDMTVTNRSNDLLWGMLGANYVTFTFLQEYMAARIGCEVGRYHHFSNNLHVYEQRKDWRADELLAAEGDLDGYAGARFMGTPMKIVPLIHDPAVFDKEVKRFVQFHGNQKERDGGPRSWSEPFLRDVADPLLNTFHMHKLKCPDEATMYAEQIKAGDWKLAATAWLQRRRK